MRTSSIHAVVALFVASLVATTTPVLAIGPTQELPAGGLVFAGQDKTEITSEDLTIGIDRVDITYVLRTADRERSALAIAFPMPTIDLAQLQGSDVAMSAFDPSNPTNFVGFWALIDGQPVEPEVDVRAFSVGLIDVTRRLLDLGLPLNPLAADVAERLAELTSDVRNDLADSSIVSVVDNIVKPLWALRTVFHWRVIVTSMAPVTIQHHYKPITGSAIWSATIAEQLKMKYCLSDEDAALLDRRAAEGKAPTVYWVHYHPAANTWIRGPSEAFRLTIDKGNTDSIASTCIKGLVPTSATTLELIASDRTDDTEIDVLFIE